MKVNIYGEPIPDPQPAAPSARRAKPPSKPLSAQVEKEVHNPYTPGDRREQGLQRVYDAAEDLLRAGRDLQTVAGITSLPLEEVRMLSQMIAQEDRAAKKIPPVDSRLGVLGTMRREIQTL